MHPPQLCWGRQQTPRHALLNAQPQQKGWGVQPCQRQKHPAAGPLCLSPSLDNQPRFPGKSAAAPSTGPSPTPRQGMHTGEPLPERGNLGEN